MMLKYPLDLNDLGFLRLGMVKINVGGSPLDSEYLKPSLIVMIWLFGS